MNKKEFRKRLDEYINQLLDYIESDIAHDDKKIVITIDRHDGIIQISNKVYDNGLPFDIQPAMLLQNPQTKDEKPKSFQQVLDMINDFAGA